MWYNVGELYETFHRSRASFFLWVTIIETESRTYDLFAFSALSNEK